MAQKQQKTPSFPLNPAQKSAAEAPVAPLLIVAGAGTGKTRTLTSRIVYLIERGTPPERICAITFTNKAAREMLNRITLRKDGLRDTGGAGASLPMIATFHSFGARILRKECRSFGRKPNFAIFDDHDSFDLLKKIVKAVLPKRPDGPKAKNRKETPAYFAQKIAEIKNLEAPAFGANELDGHKELVRAIFQKYEEALLRNNAFDFDDLIQKPVALFKKFPAALERYRGLFDAMLVDEYQDINPKQYELVKLLAGGHKNLSVVGDDEQTIYSWRYADVKTFLNFDKEWKGTKVFFLEENYRSTGNIIRAAAAVAENNQFRTPKKLWTQNPDGARISLYEAWGENDEAEWIAMQIAEAVSDAARGATGKGERDEKENAAGQKHARRTFSDFAILYRTNAQSRAIEQALIRREIPYQIFGGVKFYERREVKDAVAALRWAANHADEVARERLEKNLSKRRFAAFREKIGAAEDLKPAAVLKVFLETFGYFEYLEDNFLNADERTENIGELAQFASEFDSLPEMLEKVSLLQATDEEMAERGKAGAPMQGDAAPVKSPEMLGKANLMTIHLAKGLEFENVFIAGASEGLLPHIRSIDNDASLEEERRLMYVAMTRAKQKLHVSFFGMPSRFIAEIPEECVELAGAGKIAENDLDDDGDRGGRGAADRKSFENTADDFFEERSIDLDW